MNDQELFDWENEVRARCIAELYVAGFMTKEQHERIVMHYFNPNVVGDDYPYTPEEVKEENEV